jgi:GNAT superfamily N-acetyltransferase
MTDGAHHLEKMVEEHVEEAVALISRAMNPSEGKWAEKTMTHHFRCASNGIDDGRSYFIWRSADRISGLVGLHHYLWGPDQNVWLSWFAVEPSLQRQGHGSALLKAIESLALGYGYRKFLVETYDQRDFANARIFYASHGFSEVGRISNYLDNGSDMIVYGKELKP